MGFFDFLSRREEYEVKTVKFRNRTLRLEVADTFHKLSTGLMKYEKIAKDEGMLFIFKSDGRQGIWMVNMNFGIDIIWLDSKKRVVYIVSDAQPCRSMFSCEVYKPDKNARYVVELHSGVAKELKLKTGDLFKF